MIKNLPHERIDILSKYNDAVKNVDAVKEIGRVERVVGLTIESLGPPVSYGDICRVKLNDNKFLPAEVVGINKNRIILMPIGPMNGVSPGAIVQATGSGLTIPVSSEMLGRVISGTGEPIDGKGPLRFAQNYPVASRSVSPLSRALIDTPLSVGIRAIDGLITVGRGQRIGIFAGSGVGKSTLISMIARYTDSDVNVIALIGERGREVKDFITKELGREGLERSVVVVATSDMPPMVQLRGALIAHAIAEYFRGHGLAVNLLMDSITRFAQAQRDVGLAAGEPAATRGYPPSVFSKIPELIERAGTADNGGSITGFYSVLVEGDDMNDPVADTARGRLDGHIVLDRNLAHKGHYPAIDVLASISRCMKDVVSAEHRAAAERFRALLAAYSNIEDLINLNAYVRGSNQDADKAIQMKAEMDSFLIQGIYEKDTFPSIVSRLESMFAEKRASVIAAAKPPAFARIVR
ncbi:MAG: FliI/YscN family ATPase [Leptospirales bacterium]|nr:FliI/YscN family ATPase [Leptospirales bacterium]